MTDLSELERRLSEATGAGDRDLDAALFRWEDGRLPTGAVLWSEVPFYTSSIDSALALVERKLPDASSIIVANYPQHGWVAALNGMQESGATGGIALCLCLIRALATQEPTNA